MNRRLVALSIVAAFAAVICGVLAVNEVFAAGGASGPGSPPAQGGGSCPSTNLFCSRNGHGWELFGVGGLPGGAGGDPGQCSGRTNTIWAFTVTGAGGSRWIYTFTSAWMGLQGARPDFGANLNAAQDAANAGGQGSIFGMGWVCNWNDPAIPPEVDSHLTYIPNGPSFGNIRRSWRCRPGAGGTWGIETAAQLGWSWAGHTFTGWSFAGGINSSGQFTCSINATATANWGLNWDIAPEIARVTAEAVNYKTTPGVWRHWVRRAAVAQLNHATGNFTMWGEGDNPGSGSWTVSVPAGASTTSPNQDTSFTWGTANKNSIGTNNARNRRTRISVNSSINSAHEQTGNLRIWAFSPWVMGTTSAGPTQPSGVTDCLVGGNTRPGCTINFNHTARETDGFIVRNDTGNWQPITAMVQQNRVPIGSNPATTGTWSGVSGHQVTDNQVDGDVPASSTDAFVDGFNNRLVNTDSDHHDVGQRICQRVRSDWSARNNNAERVSTPICVNVPHNYDSSVRLTLGGHGSLTDLVAEQGSTIHNINGQSHVVIQDSGNALGTYSTNSQSSNWQIVRFAATTGSSQDAPEFSTIGTTDSTQAGCDGYWQAQVSSPALQGNLIECQVMSSGATGVINGGGRQDGHTFDTNLASYTIPDSLPLGTRLCFAFAIQDNITFQVGNETVGGNTWRHSTPACLRISKAPQIHICNAGAMAPSGIVGHTIDRTNAINADGSPAANRGVFGSWTEYEAISAGPISRFGTTAVFNTDHSFDNNFAADQVGQKTLAIGNIEAPNFTSPPSGNNSEHTSRDFGFFQNSPRSLVSRVVSFFRGIAESFSSEQSTYSDDILTANTHETAFFGSDNLRIAAGGPLTIPRAHTAIVVTRGNVEIANNIVYDQGVMHGAADIPQLVIVTSGTIRINDNVTRIDAWLIASGEGWGSGQPADPNHPGTIMTCASGNESADNVRDRLSSNICNLRLNVHGPVFADRLHLFRTHGAEADNPRTPAETFTLPSSAFLWARNYAQERNSNFALTVFSRGLPPRY